MNIHQETEKRRLFKFLTVATNFELQVKSKHNLASLVYFLFQSKNSIFKNLSLDINKEVQKMKRPIPIT